MRLLWALATMATLTVLLVVLVRGDGAHSGGILLTLPGEHGVNKNDAPVFFAWGVGVMSTGVLLASDRIGRPSSLRGRRVSALIAVAMLTVLFGMLVLGDGPGSETTRLAVSSHHGLNRDDLPLLGVWALGLLATGLLYAPPRH